MDIVQRGRGGLTQIEWRHYLKKSQGDFHNVQMGADIFRGLLPLAGGGSGNVTQEKYLNVYGGGHTSCMHG